MIVNSASNTSAAIALPSVGKDLHIEDNQLEWLVSAFALSSGCLLLFFGRLADLYGRKKAFVIGSIVQAAFSLGCGFAKNQITIDILRGLQGCGAAATIPACLGILAHSFPPSRMRSVAFATFAAGAPLGAAFGNTFGAVLTQLSGPTWRSVFYFSAALNVMCIIGGLLTIDPDRPSTELDKRVDYLGAFLVTAGLTLIIFVLSDAAVAPQGWSTPYIIALLVLGHVLLCAFIAWQWYLEQQLDKPASSRHLPPPIMKLSMWTRSNGRFTVMQFIAFLEWCSFLSYNFWIQLFYQDFIGLNPILTMVRLLPMVVTGVCCNVIVALCVGRVDVVYLMVLGTALTASANIFFALVQPAQSYWSYGFPSAIFSVFGADFVFAAGTLFIAKISLPHEQSVAGALFQTMTQLGTSFGLAITTIVFNRVQADESAKLGNHFGADPPKEAQLLAYRSASWGAFAFGVVGSILAAVFLRGVGIVGNPRKEHASREIDSEGTIAVTTMDESRFKLEKTDTNAS
jgi:MFS family permease